MAEKGKFKTTVGGQAVMEGVMMQGPDKWCLAVRQPNGEICAEVHDVAAKHALAKVPFVRGITNYITTLLMGYQTMMRSAELATGEENGGEEPSKFEKWVDKTFGDKGTKVLLGFSAVMGVALALGLFMVLPTGAVGLFDTYVLPLGGWKTLLEGLIKIGLFVSYLAVIRLSKDIRRVFGFHGAEHKTIYCYESGEELTVENVRHHSRFHPRCGTSFLLIVLVVSILLFSVVPWTSTLLRVGIKLLMLPLVMSISYEIIRLAGRYDNVVTRIISAPGMWLQRLTTDEPDDTMIEVAMAAVTPVLPAQPEAAKW